MARTDSLTNFLTDVADSIREKKGTNEPILASDFDTEIDSIETGIEPTGTLDITTNGVYDVTNYANANVSVGENVPTKGLIINSWDADGYATDASIIGMTEIPDFYLYGTMYYEYTNGQNLGAYLNKVGANLHLPETLTKIGNSAFYNCYSLALTSLPSRITEIGEYAFYGCFQLGITSLPSGIKRIKTYAFHSCSRMPLAELPPELELIDSYAFYYCPELELTNLPDTLTYIDGYAFYRCENLPLSSLPSGLTNLGSSSFRDCKKITINKVPSGITVLNGSTFYNCSSLTEMTLEGLITSISSNVFYGCSKLEKLVMPNVTKVPTLSNKNSFTNTPIANGTGYIYVPDTLVNSFKSASNWSTYANQIKGVSEL